MTQPSTPVDDPSLPEAIRLALPIIMDAEGFRPIPYLCPASVWTIGYGHTRLDNRPVHKNTRRVEEPEARRLLVETMKADMEPIQRICGVTLLPDEMAALLSFVHNFGLTKFRHSTLAKLIYEGRMQEAAVEFGKWVTSGGQTLPGLVKRRDKERRLFLGYRA